MLRATESNPPAERKECQKETLIFLKDEDEKEHLGKNKAMSTHLSQTDS